MHKSWQSVPLPNLKELRYESTVNLTFAAINLPESKVANFSFNTTGLLVSQCARSKGEEHVYIIPHYFSSHCGLQYRLVNYF